MGATGAFGEAPYGAMKHVRGVPTWVAETHVSAATGGFGGAPHGATKLRGVCQDGWRGRMQVPPQGPSVELPMVAIGPGNV